MADTKLSALTALAAEPALDDELYIRDVSEAAADESKKITTAYLFSGRPLQVVNLADGAYATGTTAIPNDDTIPQITEGTQFMSLAITPLQSTSLLRVDVVAYASVNSANVNMVTALFRDATTNALAVSSVDIATTSGLRCATITHWVSSGSTSATTFTVRIGNGGANAIYFNGGGGARKMGGVLSSTITITEYAA